MSDQPLEPGDPGFVAPQPRAEALTGDIDSSPGQQVDYFGFSGEGKRWYFPDGLTYMEFRSMNEGQKKRFQKTTSRDITLKRGGDASIGMDVAEERWALILTVTSGWNLTREGNPVPFSTSQVQRWLDVADPKLVSDYEFAIRKENPWLQGDMSSEDLQEEIDRLGELLKEKKAEEDRKASSSSS